MSETMKRPLLRLHWMCSCGAVVPSDQSSCYVCQRPGTRHIEQKPETSLGTDPATERESREP